MSRRQRLIGLWLLPMVIVLVVVVALMAVLLVWHQRQKRRTLSRCGKRNRVMDACAGPARVPDEEATTRAGLGGNKCSGAPETESCGQRPNLSTFFSIRKPRQGCLVGEERKPGTDPNLKGEDEPLVGSEDKAVETPTCDKPQVKDGAAPQSQ